MAFQKKTWKNRISEFFNRYRLENVKTGEAFNAYINLNDGAVEEQGDRLNADTLNDLEDRIEQAFEEVVGGEVYISGVETTSTASQAYAVGQYLIYNSILYKVIGAIAQGNTLTVGTNISATTVGSEITNANTAMNRIRTYVGTDSKLHFTDATGADSVLPFKSAVEFTLTISFGNSTSARPASHSEDYLQLSGSSTFRFTETSQVKVKTYSVSGVTVSHSGSTWTFSLSASGYGTGYNGGNWASTSKSGTATITFIAE